MSYKNIIQTLRERGFIDVDPDGKEAITNTYMENLSTTRMLTCYAGFDPSAPSLHVGHLMVIMAMSQFQRHGHRPIALVGGATGLIGDPAGKTKERVLMSPEEVRENVTMMHSQLEKFLDFSVRENAALVVNNADWLLPFNLIDFLRDVGKHFSLNEMMRKVTVRNRQEESPEGMSFTAFSYQLLQAYDFLYLLEHHDCSIQIGGSDQWGNITAGIDFIRKKGITKDVCGIVFPLLTSSSGKKFGKSEGEGNVWLDPKKTSPYQFYQFWIRTTDMDVVPFLNYFTLLDTVSIMEISKFHRQHPERREAQKTLAKEVTTLVHGNDHASRAASVSEVLYGKELEKISEQEWETITSEVPTIVLKSTVLANQFSLLDLLVLSKTATSRNQGRHLVVEEKCIFLNNVLATDANVSINTLITSRGNRILIRKGKKGYVLVRFE